MKRLHWKPIVSTAAVATLLIFGKTFASDGDKLAQNSTPPAVVPIPPKDDGDQSIKSTQVVPIIVVKVVPTPPAAKALTAKALPNDQVTYTFSIDSSASSGLTYAHVTADFREIYNISGTSAVTVTTGSNAKQAVFPGGLTTVTFDIYPPTSVSVVATMPSNSAGKQYLLSVKGAGVPTEASFAGGDIISVATPATQ